MSMPEYNLLPGPIIEAPAPAPSMNGGGTPSPTMIALRTLALTARLQEWVTLLGALGLFVWVAAAPDLFRLLGACAFSAVALILRLAHTGGST